MKDAGELTAEIAFNPDEPNPLELTPDAEPIPLVITWPLPAGGVTPATWTIDAVCTGYEPSAPIDDRMTASITWKLSGMPVQVAST